MADEVENELLDYEEQEEQEDTAVADGAGDAAPKKEVKGTYVSIHSSGFRDFLLKPELLRAIVDCGFEHPSEGKIWSAVFIEGLGIPGGISKVRVNDKRESRKYAEEPK